MPSELRTRALSAVLLGSAVLLVTWYSAAGFCVMCVIGGILLGHEWWMLTRQRSRLFVPVGMFYIGSAVASLAMLRQMSAHIVFILFALVWIGDIAAYGTGKLIGRHKIAPQISPGKTWEGLAGAVMATSGGIYFMLEGAAPWWFACVYGTLFASVGLAGDLFESSLKRRAGVKDSGTLVVIPGHGGLFDRVDALIPCAILLSLLVLGAFYYASISQPF